MQSTLQPTERPNMSAAEKLEEITPLVENLERLLSLHSKLTAENHSITADEYNALILTFHHLICPIINTIRI